MAASNRSAVDIEAALRRAKHPRTALAGPYGHPIHAILVTVPIGAWISSLVFDLAAAFGADPVVFGRGAQWLIGIGLLVALLAAVFGLIDLLAVEAGTRARKLALTHMGINLSVVALFAVSFFVRLGGSHERLNVAGLVLSILALVLLSISGYLGGELAYRFGVRVADEDTQRLGFDSATR